MAPQTVDNKGFAGRKTPKPMAIYGFGGFLVKRPLKSDFERLPHRCGDLPCADPFQAVGVRDPRPPQALVDPGPFLKSKEGGSALDIGQKKKRKQFG